MKLTHTIPYTQYPTIGNSDANSHTGKDIPALSPHGKKVLKMSA